MMTRKGSALVPVERIAHSILILREQRVLLDSEQSICDHQLDGVRSAAARVVAESK